MAYKSGASAPPYGEPDARARANTKGPDRASEAAQRSKLAGTGVYKAGTDTGSKLPSGKATAPLVLGRKK